MNRFVPTLAFLAFLGFFAPATAQTLAPADYVDARIGTAATGHTIPAACAPFGLIQAGPDTGDRGWEYCSGYRYPDQKIIGFSQTHLNGTGGADLGDLRLIPFFAGKPGEKTWPGNFIHDWEVTTPGYYSVMMPNAKVRVEITATPHAAFYRIWGEGALTLRIDPKAGIGGTCSSAEMTLAADGTGLTGTSSRKGWVGRTFAYAVRFDRADKEIAGDAGRQDCRPNGDAAACRVVKTAHDFHFDIVPEKPLLVKLALSAEGGVAAAERNLAAEIPAWDFDAVRAATRAQWDEYLSRLTVEGSDDEKVNFYTALYHLFQQPNNIADVGAKPFYSTFSCWDTFRAAGPLYTLLVPELVPGMIDSMLAQGKRTGYLPIWTLWGKENQCMIGTHSIPMIVDWFLKSPISSIDWEAAYRQVKDTLTEKHEGRYKEQWDILDKYGYYPFDLIKGESVSRTMECAYDDWCAAQMAGKLGHREDEAFFLKRAGNWKNVFDSEMKLVRGRDSKGNWRTPYNPYALGHGAEAENDFTEGNAFQYTWHVMQDPEGLMAAMGGRDAFVKKLDSLFTENSKAEGMGEVLDVTGLIGQYVHGNEPSHHVAYFYTLAGQPDKTAERVREIFDKFYLPKPDGLCGNDDCGQMSAWYLFSAMGFYPFNPCGGEYVLGAPQMKKVKVKVPVRSSTSTSTPTSTFLTITARNLSRRNKYVKGVTLNGKPFTAKALKHADLMAGGELVFEMGSPETGATKVTWGREPLWPEGKIPDFQPGQIGAMTYEEKEPGFNRARHQMPYIEWFEPKGPDSTDICMILISGGGYNNCCDVSLVRDWCRKFTERGITCANLVYRTPRPANAPYYRSAWQDGQRAVRLVRSEAAKRGFSPDKIGAISMSAGSHLNTLLATSSETPAYGKVDALDDIPCNLNWACTCAIAYGTTDGPGTPAAREGDGAGIAPEFKFDKSTCPMWMSHGGVDIWSPLASTKVYRKLRQMKVPAEIHLYADEGHGPFGFDRAVEFMRMIGAFGPVPETYRWKTLDSRFSSDEARASYEKKAIWPAGRTPDFQEEQCEPYLEWHVPKVLKTKAIQIIYSGGGYAGNGTGGFEVAPARRHLNEKGMTVVTMRYRTPRPKGLAKHVTAWQDLQRAIRLVRAEAPKRGLDPNRIGIMGSSAGGHLTLMGATSARHRSYVPIDEIDRLPCNVQWAIAIYPAYALTDGLDGHNTHGGNLDGDILAPEFSFDLDTCPILFIHGDRDGYAAMASVKCWERLRRMGIQGEVHTLVDRPHCFHAKAIPGTASWTWLERIDDFFAKKGFNR